MINRSLASGSQQCLDQRIAFPLPDERRTVFSWTRKPRESDCAQFQSIPAFHRAVAGATARLVADAVAMATVFRWQTLQVVASVPSARADFAWDYRVQSDFIRCESRQTGPVGACSWLCECTQPVRCRSLNAAARSHPHRRHRQRPSRLSIRRCQA